MSDVEVDMSSPVQHIDMCCEPCAFLQMCQSSAVTQNMVES